MKNSRIVLALLALAAIAATGFSTANSSPKAKDCCAADSACCSTGASCCGK